MIKIDDAIITICVLVLTFCMGYILGVNTKQEISNIHNDDIDTTYNKIVLDSIEYNIIKKDSVIYNLKTEMQDEIEKSYILNDSASVKLFESLVK